MFNHKRLMAVAVVVALAMVLVVPSWGAQFRKVKDQRFVEMCEEGNTQGVIEAINAGANVNAKGKYGLTALMWAAGGGHTEIVKALIQAGADVNVKRDDDGLTALMWAARTEIVKALIQAGADVNAKDNNGWTALIRAALSGRTEIVKALIQAGADANANNNDGITTLMLAARLGDTETVNALIEAGADDLTDNNGKTALIYSTEHTENSLTNPETVNALIDAGSNVKHRDNYGKMALDYARDNPHLQGSDALKRLEELSK